MLIEGVKSWRSACLRLCLPVEIRHSLEAQKHGGIPNVDRRGKVLAQRLSAPMFAGGKTPFKASDI
jgi:hypothetical protein